MNNKPTTTKTNSRFWEIDFLRGVAVVMMIIFHLVFNMVFFAKADFNIDSGWWFYFARVTASLFILLAGISLSLSWDKGQTNYSKYLKRGLWLFGWGLAITLVTWILFKEDFVFFGILHFLGLATIMAYPFLKFKWFNLFFGSILIGLGLYLKNLVFNFSWLVWLGFQPADFFSLDYVPILPWFGLVLFGVCLGKILYTDYQRQFIIGKCLINSIYCKTRKLHLTPELVRPRVAKALAVAQGVSWGNQPSLRQAQGLSGGVIKSLCWLGQNSLMIYLVHQPILISMLIILKFVNKI